MKATMPKQFWNYGENTVRHSLGCSWTICLLVDGKTPTCVVVVMDPTYQPVWTFNILSGKWSLPIQMERQGSVENG
jgi:hypothetical protein